MIPVISWGIAALGMMLIAILVQRILSVDAELKLKKHRSKQAGLADLLNYASVVEDGIILGKNGSLMAAWTYRGVDAGSIPHEVRNSMSSRINQALSKLGSGWMIHMDVVRKPAPGYPDRTQCHFPDTLTQLIDEERRTLFESIGAMYRGDFFLTLTWFPPVLAQQKFVELLFDDDRPVPDAWRRTVQLIEKFQKQCQTLESDLSSVLAMERLKGQAIFCEGRTVTHDAFLSWIQYCITGLSQPMVLPKNPSYLDAVIGGQDLWSGVIPKIGKKFIQVVSIEGFPLESHPGMLNQLAELSSEYRWSNRFIFMDNHEAVAHLEKYRKKWRQKIRGFLDQVLHNNNGVIDRDAAEMVNDAEESIADINSGAVVQGYYTSVFVLMDEDRETLAESAQKIQKVTQNLGFAARIEDINTMDAYLGSLPGHGVENVRRPLINSLNYSDLIPTSTIWSGGETHPCAFYPANSPALMSCIAQGTTPFYLNLHVGDVGHSVVFGPTGSGKSVFLNTLAAQLRRYGNMSVFIFDVGGSSYALTAGIRAFSAPDSVLHFDLGHDDQPLSFCPLQYLDTKEDRAWAAEWIETLLTLNRVDLSVQQRNEIVKTLENLHHTQRASGTATAVTLSDFSVQVQDNAVREGLEQYLVDGAMGALLDAQSDGLNLADFTVFDIEKLMNMGDKYALPVLLYVFRRIQCALKGQPAAIILDEAWLMLSHPVFKEKIREWLKTLRRSNCMVIFATQNLSDAAQSGILDVITESTASKIFLPNPNLHSGNKSTWKMYESMGLNDVQMRIIAKATPKREYYYVSSEGQRLFQLGLGELTLSFVGASDKDSIATIKKLEKIHGRQWVHIWLEGRGLELFDRPEEEAVA